MSVKIKNDDAAGKVFYGLHMVEGVAEYREPQVNDGKPYRILLDSDTIKNMDATFAGRPVFVQHVDEVDNKDKDKLREEADGWVAESFFNKCDGKHWVKFIVVSDRGQQAIAKGWKLSNAYHPLETTGGGLWHAVEYAQKILRGEYEHLAIVPNPRYEESIILTPEEFKLYNSAKELELSRVANSKDKGAMSMFNIFKKTKVDNAGDLESMMVTLPKCKRDVALSTIINGYDEMEKKNADMAGQVPMANGDHHVMVGEDKMTVNELVAKHLAVKDAFGGDEADKDAKAAEAQGEGELKVNEEEEAKKKKENEEKEMADKKANEEKEKADKEAKDAKKNASHFKTLKDAPLTAIKMEPSIDLSEDRVARGKARYGS